MVTRPLLWSRGLRLRVSDAYAVVPYDLDWPRAFSAERDRIAHALGALAVRIDHHGSTSVPGLASKSVIDIQVSVPALQPMEIYAGALLLLGYAYQPRANTASCVFFHNPSVRPDTYHVRVVESGGAVERRTLAFRDYLRDHFDVARAYEDLKRGLALQRTAADVFSRREYAGAKRAFVDRLTDHALTYGYPLEL